MRSFSPVAKRQTFCCCFCFGVTQTPSPRICPPEYHSAAKLNTTPPGTNLFLTLYHFVFPHLHLSSFSNSQSCTMKLNYWYLLLASHLSLASALVLPGWSPDFPSPPSSSYGREIRSDHDDFLYPTNEIATHDHGPENKAKRDNDAKLRRGPKITLEDSPSVFEEEYEGTTHPSLLPSHRHKLKTQQQKLRALKTTCKIQTRR